ncbi:unnamed protein product [Rotaria magnacalcarata]|uniref:TM2 domain-containing protein n=2 Tax=Rotaria TaxID=231623 RepID=A0A819Q4B5_9BILA|nr:unnamed protein product [Rotaria magnacalcarata]CAF1686232.1 unnamed protein product [Rotaria magnacalcarata]CAF2036652.1 unnamed protein product [Rotaria magnacalcarata]CAF2079546.1 unnamed protein product [Rotaria magnacalcarata]CAF2080607.1 unnamed protein product [Rotaria magnacalcarata]
MILLINLLLLIVGTSCFTYRDEVIVSSKEIDDITDDNKYPYSPIVQCHFLPSDYYECESVEDIPENDTRSCQKRNGRRFGGEKYIEVEHTSIRCRIFDGIECKGNRSFLIDNIPCIKYSSHYFISTLLYSIFLGLFAVDRYSLGHIGIAVGKMITLGGLGLWWIIDIILLICGKLNPQDDSNWIIQH